MANELEAYMIFVRNHRELAELCRLTLGMLQEQQHDGHRRHCDRIRNALARYELLTAPALHTRCGQRCSGLREEGRQHAPGLAVELAKAVVESKK